MITRIYFKFEGKANAKNKVSPTLKEPAVSSLKRKLKLKKKDRKGRPGIVAVPKTLIGYQNATQRRIDVMEEKLKELTNEIKDVQNE